jgi:hypothetical protein
MLQARALITMQAQFGHEGVDRGVQRPDLAF